MARKREYEIVALCAFIVTATSRTKAEAYILESTGAPIDNDAFLDEVLEIQPPQKGEATNA